MPKPPIRQIDIVPLKVLTPCATCAHRNADGFSCKAFARIPQEILLGKNDHRVPVAGDNGIVYQAKN